MPWSFFLFGALVAAITACGEPRPVEEPLRLWHTFGPEETEALNHDLARLASGRVRATVLPFGRAHNRIRDVLGRRAPECPDLIRIDATWLPGLAQAGLLAEAPDGGEWLPQADELALWNGRRWGLPQTVDCLALLFDEARVTAVRTTPPRTVEELVALARALTRDGTWGLSLRSDGYWFVPWLRAQGGELFDPVTGPHIDTAAGRVALAHYVALAGPGGVAPAPSLAGDEAAEEARRFAAGEVAIVVGGPWTLAALIRAGASPSGVGIWPFPDAPDGRPAAPSGGHLWAVPACSRRQAEAWELARGLTEPAVQARWSQSLGVIPTRPRALDGAGRQVRLFVDALAHAAPLPRHPVTPLLFDDLTPAMQAALAGDATTDEVLTGVSAGWGLLVVRPPLPPHQPHGKPVEKEDDQRPHQEPR